MCKYILLRIYSQEDMNNGLGLRRMDMQTGLVHVVTYQSLCLWLYSPFKLSLSLIVLMKICLFFSHV